MEVRDETEQLVCACRTLPSSLFAAEAAHAPVRQRRAHKGERAKRKPSAFNQFIKEKIEELQHNGEPGRAPGPGLAHYGEHAQLQRPLGPLTSLECRGEFC